MDFQNRVGSKVGSGGVASTSETNRDRRERLRQLAMETIDINKVGPSHALGCLLVLHIKTTLHCVPWPSCPYALPAACEPALEILYRRPMAKNLPGVPGVRAAAGLNGVRFRG